MSSIAEPSQYECSVNVLAVVLTPKNIEDYNTKDNFGGWYPALAVMAVMEKRKTFLVNFAYFTVILGMAFLMLRYALPVVMPFAVAFAIAYLLRKPIQFMEKNLPLSRRFCAIIAVVLFYGAVGGALSFLSVKAASGVVALIEGLPTMYETHVQPFFMEVLQNVEAVFHNMDASMVVVLDEVGTRLIQVLGTMVEKISVSAMGLATSAVYAIPGLFIKLVVMIISTFFIAIDYNRLKSFCLRQMSEKAQVIFVEIKEYVVGTLWVCIRSYALIMLITFVELSIGLNLAGINHAVLVAALIAVFDILPVLGTGGIMLPWTVLTAIQGDFSLSLSLLAIYVTITVIRNIIEPKIVGGQLGLHPVVTLCSMFVDVQVLGVIGLFGFPVGLSLLRHLNEHGVIKLFR